jgi:glycosyltransferase TcdB-like subunit of Tc toxin
MPKFKNVPKIFHFIWVGGDVPDQHVDNIAAWKRLHPQHRAILWYDSFNMLANTIRKKARKANAGRQPLRDVKESRLLGTHDKGRYVALADKAEAAGKVEKDVDYYVARAGAKHQSLMQKLLARHLDGADIRATGDIKKFSNMSVYDIEMANETPNLGAASDVLRLEILIRHGGIYMDVDLGCKQALPDPIRVRDDLALFGVYNTRPCNALIAAYPGSDLLKTCRDSIKESYKKLNTDAALEQAYDRDMRGFTVSHTGPTVVSMAARAAEDKAVKKGLPEGKGRLDWATENVYFPDGYVDWETDAAKVHKWITV